MRLNTGDQVVFFEDKGRLCLASPAELAFKRANKAFAKQAKQAGFSSEDNDYARIS